MMRVVVRNATLLRVRSLSLLLLLGTALQADIVGSLAPGDRVYDNSWLWGGIPIEWLVVEVNHAGAPAGSVTLLATTSIGSHAYGNWNNRWEGATLRTYLNDTFISEFSDSFRGQVLETNVPWQILNPANSPDSGTTQDMVFIASRTELGGTAAAAEGTVFTYFSDPDTAAAHRQTVFYNAGWTWTWTRTGETAEWNGNDYDNSAYKVNGNDGTFAAGNWVSDSINVQPVLNIDAGTTVSLQQDGRYLITTVPEPSALVPALGVTACSLLRRRRRQG